MPAAMPLGPFCQSCSMPMERPELFGTDAAGFRVNDYCVHCYSHGAFTDPGISLPAMLERCAGIMARDGIMPAPQARTLMAETLPRLKRWRAAEPSAV